MIPAEEAAYQLNVRVRPAVRNAYELVARRYNVSVTKVAALAPLMFAIVAEACLRDLQTKLDKYWEAYGALENADRALPSVEPLILECDRVKEIEDVIKTRDVFGTQYLNWDSDNPLCMFLKEQAEKQKTDIDVRSVGPAETDYRVGLSEAKELAGGDPERKEWVLKGEVPIHAKEFRHLRTAEERIKWMYENRIAAHQIHGETEEEAEENVSGQNVNLENLI